MDPTELTDESHERTVDWQVVWDDFQALPADERVELAAHLLDELPDGLDYVQSSLDGLFYEGHGARVLEEIVETWEYQSSAFNPDSSGSRESVEGEEDIWEEFVASCALLEAVEDRASGREIDGRVELVDRYRLYVHEDWLGIFLETYFELVRAAYAPEDFRLESVAPFARIPELLAELAEGLGQAEWSPSKTALAIRAMHTHLLEVMEKRRDDEPYRTSERRRGSRMRKKLAEACAIVPDPDEFVAFLTDYDFRDAPDLHAKAVLVESLDTWLDLLVGRELLEKRLARSLRYNLKERLADAPDAFADAEEGVGENVRAAVENLY